MIMLILAKSNLTQNKKEKKKTEIFALWRGRDKMHVQTQ